MRRSVRGRVVAITGGARGIGLATARVLAERDARVAIGDRDVDAAQRAADELGERAIALPLDVTEQESVEGFLDQAGERLGPVGALVNNAAVAILGPLVDEAAAATDRQIDVNLRGVIHGVKAAAPRMRERRAGHIVIVSSAAGRMAQPGAATYCATKHALVGLAESARAELRPSGVQVSVVFPYLTRTGMSVGQPETRGMPPLQPERVARAIASVLERPRPTAYVPAAYRLLLAVAGHTPAALRDAAGGLLGTDRVFSYDAAARAEYHERALR